jgi:proline iminopeptidase
MSLYDPNAIKPATIRNGLAIYDIGQGDPVLVMPYPHGFTQKPVAHGPLTQLLTDLGCRVITFDPPGAFDSTRPAKVDMPEMLACAEEALDTCNVVEPVDVAAHSMGALCSLALALEKPHRVNRLILIGAPVGGMLTLWQDGGMPFCWRPWQLDFWRFNLWGLRLMRGGGSLADHKRLKKLFEFISFVDKSKVPQVIIEVGDEKRPPPLRDRWPGATRGLTYYDRLNQVSCPTLVCVGRFDPQTPVASNKRLAQGIPGARLVIFEESGHSPFIEEPERFINEVKQFLDS